MSPLTMLSTAKKSYKDVGIKPLRKKAAWGNSTLAFILNQNFVSGTCISGIKIT
jgi:hypothetical protein